MEFDALYYVVVIAGAVKLTELALRVLFYLENGGKNK